jgi:uridylate kinase
MEHAMPLMVFNFKKDGNIQRAVQGETVGTVISSSQKTEVAQ